MVRSGSAVAAAAAVLCTCSVFARANNGKAASPYGRTAAINSPTEWCMFLPPKPGQTVSDHEFDAVAFCTSEKAPKNAPGARTFPRDFITASHYQRFRKYIQVTGRFNPAKYNMSRSDGGGQFDVRAPYGAVCAGYKLFVNLVEPNIGRFCVRCCKENDRKLCNSYKSEYGCEGVIQGNYGPQSNREEVPKEEYLPSTWIPPATVVYTQTVTATPTPTGVSRVDGNGRSPPKSAPQPTPMDWPHMAYPSVKVPTFRFVTTCAPDPIVLSADSGCVDLNPRGSLDWSAPNRSITYATVFIPDGVSTTVKLFVEEGCRGVSVYEIERDTVATDRPTAVDILPDFYGNFMGPQSALVRVSEP